MLIGEVSERSGVSVRMLRHYDAQGLVCPSGRTGSGYRHYSEENLRQLFEVECLRSLGMSLAQIGAVLHGSAPEPSVTVEALATATRERIADEQRLLARLDEISHTTPAEWGDVLEVVAMLHGMRSTSAAVRQQAIIGLDPTVGAPAQALAAALLSESDSNVAGALRWALVRAINGDGTEEAADPDHPETQAALAELDTGTADPDPQVRRRAIRALADIGGTDALETLIKVLDDPDEQVRDDATLAVGTADIAAATSGLVDMVVAGRRDIEAAEALGRLAAGPLGADRLVSALTARLGPQQPQDVRLRLVQALAEIPGPAATAALDALGADLDRQVALAAIVIGRARDSASPQARPHAN